MGSSASITCFHRFVQVRSGWTNTHTGQMLLPDRTDAERKALARAHARIAPLALFERPLRMERVRLASAPWLFRLPWFSRFEGYTINDLILIAGPVDGCSGDLVAHELVHVWQCQQPRLAWVRMWLSYARPSTFLGDQRGYWDNQYERQARWAVDATRPAGQGP
jgi:hypothetical protein